MQPQAVNPGRSRAIPRVFLQAAGAAAAIIAPRNSVESPAPSIADGQPPSIPARRQTQHTAGLTLAGEPRAGPRARSKARGGDPGRRPCVQPQGLSQHLTRRHRRRARCHETDRVLLRHEQGTAPVRMLRGRRGTDPRRVPRSETTESHGTRATRTACCAITAKRSPPSSVGAWSAPRSRISRRP